MMQGRNRDRDRLHLAMCSEELLERPEGTAAICPLDPIRPAHILVHNSEHAQRLTLLLEFLVDAGVVASERTHTDHRNVDKVPRMQERFSCGRVPPRRL